MRVMVFLHGTSIMHDASAGQPRVNRVRQVTSKEPAILDCASCVPTEDAVAKITAWQHHGAKICYLSSHRTAAAAAIDNSVLAAHGFPAGPLYYRAHGESYAEVARRWSADVVVEDDRESLGGEPRTAASALARTPGQAVRYVIVPEFGGLGHLPDDPDGLLGQYPPGARRSWLGWLRSRARRGRGHLRTH